MEIGERGAFNRIVVTGAGKWDDALFTGVRIDHEALEAGRDHFVVFGEKKNSRHATGARVRSTSRLRPRPSGPRDRRCHKSAARKFPADRVDEPEPTARSTLPARRSGMESLYASPRPGRSDNSSETKSVDLAKVRTQSRPDTGRYQRRAATFAGISAGLLSRASLSEQPLQ